MGGRVEGDETRPWGHFEIVAEGPGYKVKRMTVLPGRRLSYQRHARRSEHWYVVHGDGVVTIDDVERAVGVGSEVDVPTGAAHRIGCTSADPIVFIEIQLGSYFGEDDVERLADDYGRVPTA
jgi:mannose-6-phosphate isomerase